MKRFIIMFIVLGTVLLCSCGDNQSKEVSMRDWRIISSFDMSEYEHGGCFVVDTANRLDFLDISSVQTTPVCDDATCKHTDGSDCSAYGKTNHPFIYKEKMYFFKQTEFKENDDKTYNCGCELWQCDINGKNEKKLFDYPDYQCEEYNNYLLYGHYLYMTLYDKPYDKDFNELSSVIKLIQYDLDENTSENITDLVSGYSVNSSLCGVRNDKIIITTTKPEVNKPYMERFEIYRKDKGLSEKEAWKTFSSFDKYETTVYELSTDDKKMLKSDLPVPQVITPSLYIYFKGKELKAIDSKGDELLICSDEASNIKSLDNYIAFDSGDKTYLYDPDKKEKTELNTLLNIMAVEDDSIVYRTEEAPKTIVIDGEEYIDGSVVPKVEYIKKKISDLKK